MPLRLNVGLTKKMGLPNYGSVGANCNVELELDHALLQNDAEAFQQRARQAYRACRQAVQDELALQLSEITDESGRSAAIAATAPRGRRRMKSRHGRMASTRQINYALQLADRIEGLGTDGLQRLSRQMTGKPPHDLSSLEASGLIETLREICDGGVSIGQLLPTEAA